MQKNNVMVTLIGTLPPIKGISGYCIEQASSLSKKVVVEFINFKSIYPEFLYPGGTKEFDSEFTIRADRKLQIRNILTWYNPFSWLKAGLTLKGQIVHINWWTYYLFPIFFTILIFAKLRRKKIIVTIHNVVSHESGKIDIFCSKIIYGLADHLLVHSSRNKKSLVQKFKINKDKITEIPYGILTVYNRKKITKQRARKYFNLNKNQKVVLYFGTIRKYKGIDILIKAFSEVKKQVKNVKLLIAGECWTNWNTYDKLIKGLNLERNVIERIKFIPTSEVKYFFTAADLLVLPYSYFESQTAVGILGLTFNKAMVVTNVGGLPELIKNKDCIVEPKNPNELAKAIVKVLKNEKIQKELEKDSSDLVKKYSWDKIAKRTIILYIRVLNNRK
ncbi:MAG: glycosyltransferase family 4 protein [bacterium]